MQKGITLELDNEKCMNLFEKKATPILIKINSISVKVLRSENGQSPNDNLSEIQKLVNDEVTKLRAKKKIIKLAKEGDQEARVKVFLNKEYKNSPENEIDVLKDPILCILFQSLNFELIGNLESNALDIYEISEDNMLEKIS